MRRVRYFPTVLENNCLSSFYVEVDRVHVYSGREAGIAIPPVEVVGAFLTDVRNRRVMTDLL